MQAYILYFHSLLRYFILLFTLIVAAQSLLGMMGKKEFKKSNKMSALLMMIFCDLQLLLGLFLYNSFVIGSGMLSAGNVMKEAGPRFWAVEHGVSMIIALVLVHVGYAIAKKPIDSEKKFKRLFWCSFIALSIFVAMTPWEGKPVVGRPNVPALHTN